jgi:hypothetical protein
LHIGNASTPIIGDPKEQDKASFKQNKKGRRGPNITTMSQIQAGATIEERIKARDNIPKAPPAYLPTAGSSLTVDKEAYAAVQKAPRVLIHEFTLPIRSGRAWEAPAGSIVRISTPEGPQVGR